MAQIIINQDALLRSYLEAFRSIFSAPHMMVWETDLSLAAENPLARDFAEIWQTANKIVYSRTLPAAATRKTQLERDFDPEAVRRLKETVERDILIGGAELAGHAFQSGLIDECHLFLLPIIVGGGRSSLPNNLRLELELSEERRFSSGVVFLRYRTVPARTA